jgi:hypothetical protein
MTRENRRSSDGREFGQNSSLDSEIASSVCLVGDDSMLSSELDEPALQQYVIGTVLTCPEV